jgi:hypothetical protein
MRNPFLLPFHWAQECWYALRFRLNPPKPGELQFYCVERRGVCIGNPNVARVRVSIDPAKPGDDRTVVNFGRLEPKTGMVNYFQVTNRMARWYATKPVTDQRVIRMGRATQKSVHLGGQPFEVVHAWNDHPKWPILSIIPPYKGAP